MPTVKYLGHEIRVDMGGRSSGEVAWVVVDGAQICFLGGEQEARRFLRERKMGLRFGPRAATWQVELRQYLLLDRACAALIAAIAHQADVRECDEIIGDTL